MLDVNRTAYRYEPIRLPDEDETRADIVDKACNYGRVGYRMVTNMMLGCPQSLYQVQS